VRGVRGKLEVLSAGEVDAGQKCG